MTQPLAQTGLFFVQDPNCNVGMQDGPFATHSFKEVREHREGMSIYLFCQRCGKVVRRYLPLVDETKIVKGETK